MIKILHLRTDISWADFLRPQGKQWYTWQMRTLAAAGFHVLLSVWHVPPSLAEGGACASPPRRLRDYADFMDAPLYTTLRPEITPLPINYRVVVQLVDELGEAFPATTLGSRALGAHMDGEAAARCAGQIGAAAMVG